MHLPDHFTNDNLQHFTHSRPQELTRVMIGKRPAPRLVDKHLLAAGVGIISGK